MPYEDHLGNLTIGIGRLLSRGLSDDEIEYLFRNDLEEAFRVVTSYPYVDHLNDVRMAALADMAFQLGATRFAGFKRMHSALEGQHYDSAALEVLDSRYADQVPNRAEHIAHLVRKGHLDA